MLPSETYKLLIRKTEYCWTNQTYFNGLFLYLWKKKVWVKWTVNKQYAKIQKYRYKNRAFFSSLLHVIIACSHLPFFKIFSNFVRYCPNFQMFCPFLPFFNILFVFFALFSFFALSSDNTKINLKWTGNSAL